jgi:hypothetical protein
MIKRYLKLLGGCTLLLLGGFFWLQHRIGGVRPASNRPPTVLPPDSKEQIIVNPIKHSLIIVRPGKTETVTLPDRPTVIDVKKDGTVKVTASQFGFESRPFLGLSASLDGGHIALGVDGLYWKRLDLGGGVQFNGAGARVFVSLSCNVWSNTRVGITFDHKQTVSALLSVRL